MSGRVSARERQNSSIVAEREIMRFALADPETGIKPHALWAKYVHNVARGVQERAGGVRAGRQLADVPVREGVATWGE